MAVIGFLHLDLVSIEFSAGVLQGFVKGGETTVARGNEVAYRLADGVGSRELHKAEYANVVAAAVLSRDDGRPRYPSSLVGKDVELNPTSGLCLTENTEATR